MISPAVLEKFNQLLNLKSGMHFPSNSLVILAQRISARTAHLKLGSAQELYDLLLENEQQFDYFLDFVTTNLSYFYRESYHYDALKNYVIPWLLANGRHQVRIWSAGCSTGEEPYTIAMVFHHLAPRIHTSILATDISNTCVTIAKQGIYPSQRVNKLPQELQDKYMTQLSKEDIQRITAENQPKFPVYKVVGGNEELYKSRDFNDQLWRVNDQLRGNIEWLCHNLYSQSYQDFTPPKFDLIFCRNVLIYFSPKVQEFVVNQFSQVLNTDGWLFLGHTEYINNMATPFITSGVASACYLQKQHPLIKANDRLINTNKEQQGQGECKPSSKQVPHLKLSTFEENQSLKDLRSRIDRITKKTTE